MPPQRAFWGLTGAIWVGHKGPYVGVSVFFLEAVCSFLEPFRGHLSPNIDNVSEKLTLRYPHEGP